MAYIGNQSVSGTAAAVPTSATLIGASDGTNLVAPIIKGSTVAAATTDASLVVALSPNSPVKSTIKPLYGANNQAVTITMASLAHAGARQSTYIDNTSTLYEDVLFFVKYQTIASVSSTGYCYVYGYASIDGGSTYSGGATGTDGAYTLTSPTPLVVVASLPGNTSSQQYYAGPFSFCRNYGIDRLPERFGFVFHNITNQALSATAANNAIIYQGINGRFV